VTARFAAMTWAKKGVKLALLGPSSALRERVPGLTVLVYHRVGAGMAQEMDVPVGTFRVQMEHLERTATVVPLVEGLDRLAEGTLGRDAVALTFDDGYRDVYTRAWPILMRLGLPATLFLATGFLEGEYPAPIRPGAGERGEPAEPVRWEEVQEMMGSGLVEVGCHSHSHAEFGRLGPVAAREDCERADRIIEERLGVRPRSFAYPRAVVGNEDVVAARHRWALGVDGSKNVRGTLARHRADRTPIRASDGVLFFRHRVLGASPLEDRFYAWLRGARGRATVRP
jgi:peptidoglycan/xylan/chitin deacetylase (PgdA/CDA1 family)